jgi:hypothetical protein
MESTPYNVWIKRRGDEWEFWGGYANEAQAVDDYARTCSAHPEWDVHLRGAHGGVLLTRRDASSHSRPGESA